MQNTNNTITIGTCAEYEHRYGREGFAVFRKTLDPIVSFIVAKIPGEARVSDPPPIPASALQEFNSEPEAIAALNKWADAPRDVPLLKKPKEATELCRHVERPKLRQVGLGQLHFELS